VLRNKSVDINNVQYLMKCSDPKVQESCIELKQLGIVDISDLHVPREFTIPLKGNALQINNEIGRLQRYVNRKKEEFVRKKENAKKEVSPAADKRGYSTPVTSPPDLMNTTIDLIERNESYKEDGTNIYDDNARSWDETVINNANVSQEVQNLA